MCSYCGYINKIILWYCWSSRSYSNCYKQCVDRVDQLNSLLLLLLWCGCYTSMDKGLCLLANYIANAIYFLPGCYQLYSHYTFELIFTLLHGWQISAQVPKAHLIIEREGLTHAFSCTEKGSVWVAQFVGRLIKKQISKWGPSGKCSLFGGIWSEFMS